MAFLGVDPGVSGGLAVIESAGKLVSAIKASETPRDIAAWLTAHKSAIAYGVLERVSSSPQMGVKSAFTFGENFGILQALLLACGIPHELVTPATWQKAMRCMTKGDKAITYRMAQRYFPGEKMANWKADALLLAVYARRRHLKG